MLHRFLGISLGATTLMLSVSTWAGSVQQPRVPEALPYSIPYGQPISLAQARAVLAAAEREAVRHRWQYAIAVVDSAGNLVAFDKMDDTQLASGDIAQAKAKTSALYRRSTREFENAANDGAPSLLSIPSILAGEGGVPIILDGKIVGAVGASGGIGVQDGVIAAAGAAAIQN